MGGEEKGEGGGKGWGMWGRRICPEEPGAGECSGKAGVGVGRENAWWGVQWG